MDHALLEVLKHSTSVTFPALFSLINKDWNQLITSHDIWNAMMKFYIRYRRLLARKRRKLGAHFSYPVGRVSEDRYSDEVNPGTMCYLWAAWHQGCKWFPPGPSLLEFLSSEVNSDSLDANACRTGRQKTR